MLSGGTLIREISIHQGVMVCKIIETGHTGPEVIGRGGNNIVERVYKYKYLTRIELVVLVWTVKTLFRYITTVVKFSDTEKDRQIPNPFLHVELEEYFPQLF